jgi:hypothetical protein
MNSVAALRRESLVDLGPLSRAHEARCELADWINPDTRFTAASRSPIVIR